MLIPSIDLMGGKIVQLVQGEKKALESEDFDYWIDRFSTYPLVQLIDLDAAMGNGSNRELVSMLCQRLPCQAGGGIRSVDRAQELLNAGARRVIFGSALLRDGRPDVAFAGECSSLLGADRLTFAVDSRGGKVAIQGWRQATAISALEMMSALDVFRTAFLYTHVDTEGTMSGFPLQVARDLRQATSRQLIVAGGIRSTEEIEALAEIGVDAVVGMALYTGAIS